MHLCTTLTPDSSEAWISLPPSVRLEVDRWVPVLQGVLSSPKRMPAVERAAQALSVGKSTVRLKLSLYEKHGWQGLVDQRKLAKDDDECINLPAKFIEFWKKLCAENQRCSKPAHRTLIKIWRSGAQIPGYDFPPLADPTTGFPKGWTYSNLMRSKNALTEFEVVTERIGPNAGKALTPLILSTRVGLHVGQYLVFDDRWNDMKVMFQGQVLRVLELGCGDLYSAAKIAYGLKPMRRLEDGKREGLRQENMNYIVAQVVTQFGVYRGGATLMGENGTAKFDDYLTKALLRFSPVDLKIESGGVSGGLNEGPNKKNKDYRGQLAGNFPGAGKGNFRFKAAYESSHNLVHNELANLKGQVGKDRDSSPESDYGRQISADRMEIACLALPEFIANALNKDYIEYYQFCRIFGEVMRRINERTDHRLQGWEEAGNIMREWSLDGLTWKDESALLTLDEPRRKAIETYLDSDLNLQRVRKLSPDEVRRAGERDLVKFPKHSVPYLLGPKAARTERIKSNSLFSFIDKEISGDTLHFHSEIVDLDGRRKRLRAGDEFQVFINPFSPNELFVCEATKQDVGTYVGIAKRHAAIQRDDTEALQRAYGEAAARHAELLQGPRRRGAEKLKARTAELKHNNKLLESGVALDPLADESIQTYLDPKDLL